MTEPAVENKAGLRKAYGAATSRLRDAHREEFNTLMGEETGKVGIEWSPRLSAEDKKKADLRAAIAADPALALSLLNEMGAVTVDEPPVA